MKSKLYVLLMMILIVAVISGCAPKQEVVYLSSDESAQVAASTDKAAQNILTAIATNDYQLFITDFDEKMREALTEDQFAQIVKMYGKNGKAESVTLLNVEDRQDFYGVNYGVTYPKAALTMLIVVAKSDLSLVSGLWFK
ncbi:MAG TPA: hypothetical protein PKK59_05090 [Anaerolineaceae bacterium]|nr:hypothetical protein [Anaerolineaceae bacterium]